MSNICAIIVVLFIFLGLPFSAIWIIYSIIKKNGIKKSIIPLMISIGGIIIFTLLGSASYYSTEQVKSEIEEEKMKPNKEELKIDSEKEEQNRIEQEENTKETKIEIEYEDNENEEKEEQKEIEQEKSVDLMDDVSEDDFKSMCIELYNDDFFEEIQEVGTCVKVNLMGASKYKYSFMDTQGILVEDITNEYGLAMNCLGCSVMHESTKEDAVPSYFGEQIYVMFIDGGEINIDTFKTGQKFILYGIVIQNENGTFVLPKYYEEVS